VGADPPSLPVEAVGLADPVATELAKAVAANRRRATAIVAVPAVLVFGVGVALGTAITSVLVGVVIGAVLAAALVASLQRGGRAIVLRSLHAVPVDEDAVPGPATQVEGLCASMGLSPPALFVVDDPTPNALALGRGQHHAALVLTTGILELLDPVALEAVLAHELAHVKRCDITPATAGAALAVLFGVGAQEAGTVLHRVLGRGREFAADRHAVRVTRYPPGLRQALGEMTGQEAAGGLAARRAGQVTRWLFTVVLPERSGRRPGDDEITGELDAPQVRMAALDEW
jgi:Zn-dependent protease with chaperone function